MSDSTSMLLDARQRHVLDYVIAKTNVIKSAFLPFCVPKDE